MAEDSSLNNRENDLSVNMVYNTSMPLNNEIGEKLQQTFHKDKLQFDDLMKKKKLVNEMADFNLMLLRKIYDAYDERAYRVLKQFRKDKHNVIRKRYMVPVVNPNYDFDKLRDELK